MEQRISVLTIGAKDFNKLKNFYCNTIGWKTITENKDIAFFKCNGFMLSICDRKLLADVMGITFNENGFHPVTIGYNVQTEDEVLSLYKHLKNKVHILKPPTSPPFGGLFFYFTDIENNVIEVAYNPYVLMDEYNNAVHHKPIEHL